MGTKQVKNVDGPIISYSEDSGKGLIQKDGLIFKDLAGDGELHPDEA